MSAEVVRPKSGRGGRGARGAGVAVAFALLLGACGVEAGDDALSASRPDPDVIGSDSPATSTTVPVPTSSTPPPDLSIDGDDGSPINGIISNAVADLELWWVDAYPEAFGSPYEPLAGGLFAIDGSSNPRRIPCGGTDITELLDNAYYCPDADAVVWDQGGFMPQLADTYGDFTAAVVIAHEWGHVIQQRSNYVEASVLTELQADCFAGAWSRHVVEDDDSRFSVTTDELDQALSGILSLRDAPGGDVDDPYAHGSGFDRVGAFQDGYESGPERCAEYADGDPAPYQFPFLDQSDYVNQGDLPLYGAEGDDGIVDLVFPSLEAYWADTYPELSSGGDAWDPMGAPVAFRDDAPPECGGDTVEDFALFVCIPDRYVGYEGTNLLPDAYEQNGDFGVATLFATQYGLDVVNQLGSADDEVSATLQGDCFAGAWSAAVLPPSPIEDYLLVLSPGDLDEAVSVLLTFRSEDDRDRQGPGFERVQAFRQGVLRGADACPDIEAS